MRRRAEDDDDEEWLDDREAPDESDMDDEEGEDTEACPYCGREVYAQAAVCPHCGSFISFEEKTSRRPVWIVVGVVVCVAVVILTWVL